MKTKDEKCLQEAYDKILNEFLDTQAQNNTQASQKSPQELVDVILANIQYGIDNEYFDKVWGSKLIGDVKLLQKSLQQNK